MWCMMIRRIAREKVPASIKYTLGNLPSLGQGELLRIPDGRGFYSGIQRRLRLLGITDSASG